MLIPLTAIAAFAPKEGGASWAAQASDFVSALKHPLLAACLIALEKLPGISQRLL